MSTLKPTDLDEESIEHAVVHTPKGYEWVFGLHGDRIDGRKLIPHVHDDGEIEIVSAMGNYYTLPISTLLEETFEVLGHAKTKEEASALARDHYQK